MKKIKLKTLMNVTIVGALYVALTLLLAPLSYGAVQFRLSELLMILVLYNPIYSISMIFGCMIANLSSPMAQIDIWFGTLATIISIIPTGWDILPTSMPSSRPSAGIRRNRSMMRRIRPMADTIPIPLRSSITIRWPC